MTYKQLTPGVRQGGGGGGSITVSNTNTIDMTNNAGVVSSDLNYQNTDTTIVTEDSSGVKINVTIPANYTETFILSSTDITNKYVLLSRAPSIRAFTRMTPAGGIEQAYNSAFEIIDDNAGKKLTWSGKTYQAIAEAGDSIIVTYI